MIQNRVLTASYRMTSPKQGLRLALSAITVARMVHVYQLCLVMLAETQSVLIAVGSRVMADHRHNSPNQLNETASAGKVSPPTSWKWGANPKSGKIKGEKLSRA